MSNRSASLSAGGVAHPRVSVLLPAYNAERYVSHAVESILSQSYQDLELLITDDGSTDQTRRILEEYARSDARIRLSRRENSGYVVALNDMLRAARGEYVARMDADDVSMPNRIERQVEYLDMHPGCLVLGTGALIIDPDGDVLRLGTVPTSHEEIDSALLQRIPGSIYHPSTMMRREAVTRVGGYDAELISVEDADLFLRLAEIGTIANLPEPLIHYREHMQKVSVTRCQEQAAKISIVIERTFSRRGLANDRPKPDCEGAPVAEADARRKWVWWALESGNVQVARKHARHALRLEPFAWESWRVFLYALRGY